MEHALVFESIYDQNNENINWKEKQNCRCRRRSKEKQGTVAVNKVWGVVVVLENMISLRCCSSEKKYAAAPNSVACTIHDTGIPTKIDTTYNAVSNTSPHCTNECKYMQLPVSTHLHKACSCMWPINTNRNVIG